MIKTSVWVKLFAFLLCIFAGLALILPFFRGSGTVARITVDGKLIKEIDLKGVTAPYTLTVEDGNGGSNTIRVSNGSIEVIEADCPDQICVAHGAIRESGDPIVCLPHRLVVRIGAEEDAIDSVAQ